MNQPRLLGGKTSYTIQPDPRPNEEDEAADLVGAGSNTNNGNFCFAIQNRLDVVGKDVSEKSARAAENLAVVISMRRIIEIILGRWVSYFNGFQSDPENCARNVIKTIGMHILEI